MYVVLTCVVLFVAVLVVAYVTTVAPYEDEDED